MMQKETETLIGRFPVRKTRRQKDAFLKEAEALFREKGYAVTVEKGDFSCRNLIVGDPERAACFFSAHYDTPAALPFPNVLMPGNLILEILWQLLITSLFLVVFAGVVLLVSAVTDHFLLMAAAGYVVLLGLMALTVAGPANRSNRNDNTSGVAVLIETALTLPETEREKAAFLFFDLEELGLVGSRSFRKQHPDAAKKLLVNFDCVGDGEHILFVLPKKLRRKEAFREAVAGAFPADGRNYVIPERWMFYPSDQAGFKNGVGVAAFHRAPLVGYWVGRIHTRRDVVLMPENITGLAGFARAFLANPFAHGEQIRSD